MIEELARVLIAGLAGYRLASLLVDERGPVDVFGRFRRWIATPEDVDLVGLRMAARVEIETALACMWCITLWMSVAMYFAWLLSPGIPGMLAAATVAIFTHRLEVGR